MTPQHLSDEAVAAFADGVLTGHARERATRHTNSCAECRSAVQIQREAAWALRSAVAPALPTGLLDRLRGLPQVTPISTLPTAVAPDGSTMLATFAPMAALVPSRPSAPSGPSARSAPSGAGRKAHRARPFITTAAAVVMAGALAAGSVGGQDDAGVAGGTTQGGGGAGQLAPAGLTGTALQPVVTSVSFFSAGHH